MTDAELADQIERWLADDPDHMGLHSLSEAQWRGIIVAMRRQPPETLKAAYFEGYEDALKDRQPSSDMILLDEAIIAMAEDGWLYHGPEGMSESQEKCYAAYLAIQERRAMLAAAEAEGRKT